MHGTKYVMKDNIRKIRCDRFRLTSRQSNQKGNRRAVRRRRRIPSSCSDLLVRRFGTGSAFPDNPCSRPLVRPNPAAAPATSAETLLSSANNTPSRHWMRHSTRRSPVTAVGNMGFIGRVRLVTVQSCGGSAPFPGGTSADPKRPSVFGGDGRGGGARSGGGGDGVDGVVVVVVAGVTRGQKAGATGIPTLYLTSHLRPPCIVRRCTRASFGAHAA